MWDIFHKAIGATSDLLDVVSAFYSDYQALKIAATLLFLYLGRKQVGKLIDTVGNFFVNVVKAPADAAASSSTAAFNVAGEMAKGFQEEYGKSVVATLAIAIPISVIALALAAVNFYLMQRPLQELFGGIRFVLPFVGPLAIANLAAFAIVAAEFLLGLFLMAQLNLSLFFPRAEKKPSAAHPFLRRSLFVGLLALSLVEVGIAYHRELLIEQEEKFRQTISTVIGSSSEDRLTKKANAPAQAESSTLPGIAQMQTIPTMYQAILGFMMPWILMLSSDLILSVFSASFAIVTFLVGAVALVVQAPFFLATELVKGLQTAVLALFELIMTVVETVMWPLTELARRLSRSQP
ncbi:MAG: hypothetical protein HY243_08190 [Proteobacteria bacterium]|nr:hypothetical protein [Pseudomonadota bacterium]